MEKTITFFNHLKTSFIKTDVVSNAANISYFLIFAIFPFIITILNLASFAGLNNQIILDAIAAALPPESSETIMGVIMDINKNSSGTLLILSVVIGIWSASRGILSIIKSINKSYNLEETRSFVRINLLAISLTILILLTIIISMIAMVFTSNVNRAIFIHFGFDPEHVKTLGILKYLVMFLFIFIVFTILYRFSPNYSKKESQKLKYSLAGALFSTTVWIFASSLFSLYIGEFSNFSSTYGSIGGVIITLLWMNISSMIMLIGGVINASFRRTFLEQDSHDKKISLTQEEFEYRNILKRLRYYDNLAIKTREHSFNLQVITLAILFFIHKIIIPNISKSFFKKNKPLD